MTLRTKVLGIQKKSFNSTREALQWAEKTFTGDPDKAAELTRFRLMIRDIKSYERATTTITVIFDAHGAIHHLEVFGCLPWRACA